jgi:hypothetical protein
MWILAGINLKHAIEAIPHLFSSVSILQIWQFPSRKRANGPKPMNLYLKRVFWREYFILVNGIVTVDGQNNQITESSPADRDQCGPKKGDFNADKGKKAIHGTNAWHQKQNKS